VRHTRRQLRRRLQRRPPRTGHRTTLRRLRRGRRRRRFPPRADHDRTHQRPSAATTSTSTETVAWAVSPGAGGGRVVGAAAASSGAGDTSKGTRTRAATCPFSTESRVASRGVGVFRRRRSNWSAGRWSPTAPGPCRSRRVEPRPGLLVDQSRSSARVRSSAGSSARHGVHHEAKKFTTSGLPRYVSRLPLPR